MLTFVTIFYFNSSSILYKEIPIPTLTIEKSLESVHTINNFTISSASEAVAGKVTGGPIQVSYSTELQSFDSFKSQLVSVLQLVQKEHAVAIDVTVTNSRYSFEYKGLTTDPQRDSDFQASLTTLHNFSIMQNNLKTSVTTSMADNSTSKKVITIHTYGFLGNLLYGSPVLSDNLKEKASYFTSADQFENFDYILLASLSGEGPSIDLEVKLSSIEDVTRALTISQDTFDALLGLKINSWAVPLTEIKYTLGKNPIDDRLSIVANDEQQNQQFKSQMQEYWLGGLQILRPAPYLVEVKNATRDGELIFGLRR